MIIHTGHNPMKFMHTQRKIQNDLHKKWSTYLQIFQLNIKYKKGSSNYVVEFLNHPMIVALTIFLNSYGHGTIGWPQLYNSEFEFASTYNTMSTRKQVLDFHL
jgi:hypothetical protein